MREIVRGNDRTGLRFAGPEVIPDLEPLWRATYGHHAAMAPYLGELRPVDESWERRRAGYERELVQDDTVIMVAEHGGRLVGYVVGTTRPGSDIWDTGDPVGRIESLSVLPDVRRAGLGSSLMGTLCEHFLERGIRNANFEALFHNQRAISMFRRGGAVPTMLRFRVATATGLSFLPDNR